MLIRLLSDSKPSPTALDGRGFMVPTWSQNAWGKLFTKCSFPMTGTSDAKPFKEESGLTISISLSTGRVIFIFPRSQARRRAKPVQAETTLSIVAILVAPLP